MPRWSPCTDYRTSLWHPSHAGIRARELRRHSSVPAVVRVARAVDRRMGRRSNSGVVTLHANLVQGGDMKLRYRILAGVASVFALGYVALFITVSHDSPCPPVPALAAGAEPMRAITQRCYGIPAGVRVESMAKPRPADDQVLIRVRASSINPVEWYGTMGQPRIMRLQGGIGLPSDWPLGYDMAGTIEAVGAKVTRFKPGDEVFGGVH